MVHCKGAGPSAVECRNSHIVTCAWDCRSGLNGLSISVPVSPAHCFPSLRDGKTSGTKESQIFSCFFLFFSFLLQLCWIENRSAVSLDASAASHLCYGAVFSNG